jgi:crossover junction endodeoxyribonuclease RuvC
MAVAHVGYGMGNRILGLDPGLEHLGFGVVDTNPFGLTQMGIVPNPKDPLLLYNENLNKAIENIAVQFQRIIMLYDPNEIAAEIVPVGKLGSRSETTVASITVCKTLAFTYGIPWTDYGANTIKNTVTGDGYASKAKIRNAILQLFPDWTAKHKAEKDKQRREEGMKRPPGIPQDAFDGSAIALTHYMKTNGIDSI